MYIKSVCLDGFKSYGKRTEIRGFDPQFNAITGLNGSGKSNILDAICFVLGITNLHKVRVAKLQDLIYKSGQCGIDKATVTITLDNTNRDQCPPGYEDNSEITVSRQILLGGKYKYRINGAVVQKQKVDDLFCSVQLNVNNPHFLIMQGKITKVLNMKPFEILGMLEEATGTKMYEVKKKITEKTIAEKDVKLKELQTILDEEMIPKLSKFKAERAKYLEYKEAERDLEHLLLLYQAWEYIVTGRKYSEVKKAIRQVESQVEEYQADIEKHHQEIEETDKAIEEFTKKAAADRNQELDQVEADLKSLEKEQAGVTAKLKSLTNDIKNETEKKKELEKNLVEDKKTLAKKEKDLEKSNDMFQALKTADEEDSKALENAEKRYEALCAGMEINEEGEAETLLRQLMNAREEAAAANTEKQKASMKLDYCQKQLKEKQQWLSSHSDDSQAEKKALESTAKFIKNLEERIKRSEFKEEAMMELKSKSQVVGKLVQGYQDKVHEFARQNPLTQFRYTDPEPNFDRRKVVGTVCKLFKVKREEYATAIEIAAKSRLFNVVVDTDKTGKQLLKKGNLLRRTTFIPLNEIRATTIPSNLMRYAKDTFGDAVQSPLSLIEYDRSLQVVMEYVFGNVLICENSKIAEQVAFNSPIKRTCVTLDGDIFEPSGLLSGGSLERTVPLLKQLAAAMKAEEQVTLKQQEFEAIEREIAVLSKKQDELLTLQEELSIKRNELRLIEHRLQLSSYHRHKEEIANLQTEIENLKEQIRSFKEKEAKLLEKVKDLERKVEESKGGREGQIKSAEAEVKKLKAKSAKSKEEWQKNEQQFNIFNMEIEQLRKEVENTEQQIKASEEALVQLQEKHDGIVDSSKELNEKVAAAQEEYKQKKAKIAEKNKDIQRKAKRKEELKKAITQCEVKIKEQDYQLKKLKEDSKSIQQKITDLEKRLKNQDLSNAEKMSEEDGKNLEKRIRKLQQTKATLGRTVNDNAQNNLDQIEREFNEVKRKQKVVISDRQKLIETIKEADRRKEIIIKQAHQQISKDFGSIFGTLLPGANAQLVPPTGATLLQGLEIKVALGEVWLESLTELSGGQRSLAALSLILAMLLYKPAPLYILDEVDAALDLSHTQNIGSIIKTHFKQSQFIIVSLKDGFFTNANVLFKTQFVDGVSTVTRTTTKN